MGSHAITSPILPPGPAEYMEATQTALTGLATRLERDLQAAQAPLDPAMEPGHGEGQVHRLSLIKRQMYGGAGLKPLRLRILQ